MNLSKHGLGFLENPLIRETEDGDAQWPHQVERATLIMDNLLAFLMTGTVEALNDEPIPGAVEVGDVGAERDLPAKFQAQEAAIAKELPEGFLGGSLIFPQLAGSGGLGGSAHGWNSVGIGG